MSKHNYAIRLMNREDVDTAVSWAAAEGWNPGLHDADCFFSADNYGYLIGELNGEPVGCISCVAYGDWFGFIGLYIVKPEYRGQGYGIKLWNDAIAYLKGRNIGLDGVIEQQENYKKSGFKLAYRNIRFEATGDGKLAQFIVPVADIPLAQILEYDRKCFPVDREIFMTNWFNMPNAVSLAKVENGVLQGFGVIRACGNGYKIGPLFADDERIAEDLYQSLTSHAIGAPVYFDVPEVNRAAVAIAERHNMKMVFETARMYTKEEPKVDLDRVFGVTTFELG
jgi:GNAT superfamily N-acetyltransferase